MTFPLFFRRIHLIESTGISLETLFNQNSNFCFYSFHNPKQKSETHPDNRVLARGKSCLEKCHEFKIKIIVSIVVTVLSACLVAGCSSFKNGGDVNFQLITPKSILLFPNSNL